MRVINWNSLGLCLALAAAGALGGGLAVAQTKVAPPLAAPAGQTGFSAGWSPNTAN